MAHYLVLMRTTLNIDNEIAAALKALARKSDRTVDVVVNEVLRNGLATGAKPAADQGSFRVASARRGFLPGIDPMKLNQLAGDLEVDASMHTTRADETQ